MMQQAKARKDNWISTRASTAERLLAEELMSVMGLKSHSALVRTLIVREAEALNIK